MRSWAVGVAAATGLLFSGSVGEHGPSMKKLINKPEFRRWVEHSLEQQENILTVSNQGTLLHFQEDGLDLIVKTAMGSGLALKVRQKTLNREFQAYRRMDGLAGIPECYGMVDGSYLAIEFIKGVPYREASWTNREQWFEQFLAVIRSFHERGVSHGDLKSKSNIMVTADEKPCVIDFGTAFLHKPGFHPLNNRLFEYGKRLDFNAWVKHKYHGQYADASAEDSELLNYSRIEYIARKISGQSMDAVSGAKRKKS